MNPPPAEMPHESECYFLTFVDKLEEDGSFNSLSAQTTCLCALAAATKCWLQGGTEDEVKAVLVTGHEHDDDDDHGENWKQG